MDHRHRTVAEVESTAIGRVICELSKVTGLSYEQYRSWMVFLCLQMFVYPNGGSEKAIRIEKRDIDAVDPTDQFLIRSKIGKIADDDLYAFLQALANGKGFHIEDFHGTSIHVFLNRVLINRRLRAKPRRWNSF